MTRRREIVVAVKQLPNRARFGAKMVAKHKTVSTAAFHRRERPLLAFLRWLNTEMPSEQSVLDEADQLSQQNILDGSSKPPRMENDKIVRARRHNGRGDQRKLNSASALAVPRLSARTCIALASPRQKLAGRVARE